MTENELKTQAARKLLATALEAKATGNFLELCDVRFIFVGIPSEICDEYVHFDEGWEVEDVGKDLSMPAAESKPLWRGHTVLMQSICSFRICKKP